MLFLTFCISFCIVSSEFRGEGAAPHHPQPVDPAPEVPVEPDAGSAPHPRRFIAESAAAHHPGAIIAPIGAPFPDITGHIRHAVGAVSARRVVAYGRGISGASLLTI